MARTDRAFRALARAEPDVIVAALRVLAPQVLPAGAVARLDDVTPSRLDALPPAEEIDWAALVGSDALVHVECQGYRDTTFPERLFWYHLALALRHRPRTVTTTALWLLVPSAAQRPDVITVGRLTLSVTPVIIPWAPATLLLTDPATACFAAAADPGEWTVETLCQRVAIALATTRATFYQRHMAVVAAASQGRYDAMVTAMEQAQLESVIIEDLVRFGEDRGEARDEARGEARGAVRAKAEDLVKLCARLGHPLSEDQIARVRACTDVPTLDTWFEHAFDVPSADALFGEPVS